MLRTRAVDDSIIGVILPAILLIKTIYVLEYLILRGFIKNIRDNEET